METENTHIKGCSFSSTAYDKFQENGRQNIFEEVIDNLMAEGLDIPSDFIEDLPVEEKREFILNCLIPEEGPTINEMFKNIKNSETRSQHLKNSIETIKEFIKVGKQEVKKYGEVYTPITLVQEMLDTLPKDVWSNPDLKWGDFCSGMGNFPLVVIVRLMKGLEGWEPDTEKRYKHIIENMIYVGELQPRNAFIYLCLVDPNDEYDVNLYVGSFLDESFDKHMKNVWELDKYDIIVGNPPYNNVGGLKTGGKNLYQKFIKKSLVIYSKYISFVTPPGFYKTTIFDKPNDIFKLLTNNHQLSFLNCKNISERFFNVGTPIVYYLIKNKKYNKETEIVSEYGNFKLDVSKFNFIPRIINSEIYTILDKVTNKGINLDVYRDDKKKKSVNQYLTLSTLNHLSIKGYWNVEVGNNNNRKRLLILTESPLKLKKVLNTKLYRFIFYVYRHDGAVYHRFLSGLKVPDDLDCDVYEYFNLTEKEIKFINYLIK